MGTVPSRPLLTLGPATPAPRVAVITGSYGAGHNSAARELARVLSGAGCEVEVYDIVALLPWRLGPLLRAAYYAQLRRRPDSWGTTLRLLEPGKRLHRLVTRLLRIAVRPVVDATADCDLVVSTHHFGAQALGHARATGLLTAPTATYLTDTSVHALWIHPGVDLNLAIHQVAADEARRWGGNTTVVRPLVPPADLGADGADASDPLAAYHLSSPRALVTGGSLGMGDLERTARDILHTGLMTPVVLCGTDTRLHRRLSRIPGIVALGWRDDIAALMASSDCIVQNAGGFTSLEALASGTPVITYRPLPGHGIANSANLDRASLIPWVHGTDELASSLRAAMHAPHVDRLPDSGADVLSVLVGVTDKVAAA